MAVDIEPALLRGHVHGHECNGDIDIEQYAARLAMHMVVPFYPAVVAAGLISEGQFLDQPMLGKEMKRAVDRPVPDMRIMTPDALEDLPSGEMRRRLADGLENRCALGCIPETLTWHDSTFRHPR